MTKMSDLHCPIVIRLGISMLRRSNLVCVISGSKAVNDIF